MGSLGLRRLLSALCTMNGPNLSKISLPVCIQSSFTISNRSVLVPQCVRRRCVSVSLRLSLLPLLPYKPSSLSPSPYPHCGGCQLSQQQLVPITRALTERDDWPTTHTHTHTHTYCPVLPRIHFTRELKTDGIQTLQNKPYAMCVCVCVCVCVCQSKTKLENASSFFSSSFSCFFLVTLMKSHTSVKLYECICFICCVCF